MTPERPELIRDGENSVWKVKPGVIARISRTGDIPRVERELRIANWLADCDFPTVRPITGIEQPVVVDGAAVTFWENIGPHRHGRARDVAVLLRRLHDLPRPDSFDPGLIDPFVRLEVRLRTAATLEERERDWMLSWMRDLQRAWNRVPAGMDLSLVHGDAWVGNVARLSSGRMLLMDLERAGMGPPEWDLVSTAIKLTSFAWIGREEYLEFCQLYGSDVTSWAGFEILRDIRELRMTTYVLQRADADPAFEPEARLRVRCLRGLEGPRPWDWHPTD